MKSGENLQAVSEKKTFKDLYDFTKPIGKVLRIICHEL